MNTIRHLSFIFLIITTVNSAFGQKYHIKPINKFNVKLNEPSEIVYLDKNKFLVLANKAFMYEVDATGKVLRELNYKGYDLEAACIAEGKLYVVDESYRTVTVFDQNYKVIATHQINFSGSRNLSFESLTYNPETKMFYAATEKKPAQLFEFDQNFNMLNQYSIKGIKEVSALNWHNGQLYILSDEQHTIFKADVSNRTIIQQWEIPVINPEGLAFDENDNLLIVSDDMNKLFTFRLTTNEK
jgi:uncharacterized protein YjiK